jgi:hypothetical protein
MKRILTFISLVTLFASCSPKIPFTEAIRKDYSLTENEIKQIQFYTSSDIILVRGTKDNDKATQDHTLTVKSGKQIEEIVIPKGTPGMVEVVHDNDLRVSFERGVGRNLSFGVTPNGDGSYKFIADEWKDDKGKVMYEGRTYFALKGAENSQLLFRLKSLEVNKTKRRVAGGKSFNGVYQ